jgi:hypothetical protein
MRATALIISTMLMVVTLIGALPATGQTGEEGQLEKLKV